MSMRSMYLRLVLPKGLRVALMDIVSHSTCRGKDFDARCGLCMLRWWLS